MRSPSALRLIFPVLDAPCRTAVGGAQYLNCRPDRRLRMGLERLPKCQRWRWDQVCRNELLRLASDHVIQSMLAVIEGHGPGTSKHALVEALRREEVSRGLIFDYCLITAKTSLNRAPSDHIWQEGDILSLDSGGNYQGYIGNVCRMAITALVLRIVLSGRR